MNATSFDIKAETGAKGDWKITVEEGYLTITALEGDQTYRLSIDDRVEKVEIQDSKVFGRWLFTTVDKKKRVGFRLDESQLEVLKQWYGPPTHELLKSVLEKRLKWSLPIGLVFILTSFPVPADPELGLEAIPADWLSGALGVSLMLTGLLAKIRPSRRVFLVDSIWFTGLAASTLYQPYSAIGFFDCVITLLILSAVAIGLKDYQRFANLAEPQGALPAAPQSVV